MWPATAETFFAGDPWYRGVALHAGPDGGVYLADWSDTGECHNYEQVDRTTGRIYKITYGKPKPFSADLARLPDEDLVRMQLHPNDWQVRHARRILQERSISHRLAATTRSGLVEMLGREQDVIRRLRALWALLDRRCR